MANKTARSLRKQMTLQEVKLWVYLRAWKNRGFHFRRQAPRGGYILDFVCLKHRLVVELDGGQQNFDAHARRDAQRDAHLAREGFRILRFWNNEVDENPEGVLMVIEEALREPPPGLTPTKPGFGHPPPSGQGYRIWPSSPSRKESSQPARLIF